MLKFGSQGSARIGDIYCKYHLFDKNKPVVVSFSHLAAGVDEKMLHESPSPWGFDFLLARNLNVLSFSFIDGKYNFYRDRELLSAIPIISKELAKFPERLGYGISAGGYAISAFSNALNFDRVLLLGPISTLRRDINTWDMKSGRFIECFDYDWNEPYSDGASVRAQGYVLYDPFYDPDRAHAVRYSNLTKLKLPGTGHYIARRLALLGMLPWTVDSFLSGGISEREFYSRLRGRRDIAEYYTWMLGAENERCSTARAHKISAAMPEKIRNLLYNENLSALRSVIKPPYEPADVLRDIALIFERGGDISTALALMKQAHHLRPDGPFIKRKYEDLIFVRPHHV